MTSRFMSSFRTLMPASLRSHSSLRIFRLSGDCTNAQKKYSTPSRLCFRADGGPAVNVAHLSPPHTVTVF